MATVLEIEGWLNSRNFDELFRRDQLTWMRSRMVPVCLELLEAPVAFWPTYKYKPRTSQYDRRRPPSWCDRVLYGGTRIVAQRPGVEFKAIKYDRVRALHSSDHKPVFLACQVTEFDASLDVDVSSAATNLAVDAAAATEAPPPEEECPTQSEQLTPVGALSSSGGALDEGTSLIDL
eukprot:Protomagalhaensia_sp_Gyna_25__2555@NODE_2448_length_1079_cov_6_938462_g2028_i0_p2_GENE_NODE_2448_length_1079_cov_6_938462_g2028_i0NODE_2448_length_1079_cov_6_938462_g2028_i0_p2_ORF_typecomplete_len190_score36_44Exo_endo_phos/PF03372_23/0_014_NODE_2448_length_1079_cov_6_938462_g2028_i05081038